MTGWLAVRKKFPAMAEVLFAALDKGDMHLLRLGFKILHHGIGNIFYQCPFLLDSPSLDRIYGDNWHNNSLLLDFRVVQVSLMLFLSSGQTLAA
jgi:hypothetical protein